MRRPRKSPALAADPKAATFTPSLEISARYFGSGQASRKKDRLKAPCWMRAPSPIGGESAIADWERSRFRRAAETGATRKATGVPGLRCKRKPALRPAIPAAPDVPFHPPPD